jgi:tetratricopeptide (TPR) repeat protein
MSPKEDRNHVAYVRGDKAFRMGRYSEAIAWFKEAVAEWSDDYQAHFALANSYSEARKYRKAEAAYREALSRAPSKDMPGIQFNLANALHDQGRYDEAISAYMAVPRESAVYAAAMRNMELTRASTCPQHNYSSKPTC